MPGNPELADVPSLGASQPNRIQLTPSMIPTSPDFDVRESPFFEKWARLPSPAEVREKAKAQHAAGINPDKRKNISTTGPRWYPPPVVFEDQGLFVKWGMGVNMWEAQSLYAVCSLLHGDVPVPRLHGWRMDGEEKFIYMDYIQGQTLEQIWDEIEPSERRTICTELRNIVRNLRQIEQDPSDTFIGNVARGPLYDRVFHVNYLSEAGPFTTIRDFHDWFTFLPRRRMADPFSVPIEPFRYELPDEISIKFTHGDLHRSNFIVTQCPPYHILAVVDWEQSGWFPAYWEVRKAHFTVLETEEWATIYLPMILDQHEDTRDPWEYYVMFLAP